MPTTASSGNQSIAVLRFDADPPVFSATTNSFTTLFLTQNNPDPNTLFVDIPVTAGDRIGILGYRGTTNSYGSGDYVSDINGIPVTLGRLGMQFPLTTTAPRDIWREFGATTSISRVEMYYDETLVTDMTATTADGAYGAGSVIDIVLTYRNPVTVTGSPTLALNSGGTATYTSGSGSNTLHFSYTVAAGEGSVDLDYSSISSLTLPGGATIRDSVPNDAILTLATPGAARFLSANKNIVIDTTPPDTTIVTSPTDPTNDNTPTFTFSGNDGTGSGVASFEVNVDSLGWTTQTSPFTTSTLSDGSHTFQVRAIDAAGNTDPTPASYTFVVDTTPPDTTIVTSPTDPTNDNTPSFTFSGNDGTGSGVASFEVNVDSLGWTTQTSPFTTSTLSDGSHTFEVRAVDAAGNTDPTPASYTFVVDTVAPTVTGVTATTADGTYKAGNIITIKVTFDDVVMVTGTPQLTLETGTIDAVVNFSGGSGSKTLTFNYTVATGDNSTDLDYLSTTALSLNGGTIQDAAGNNATLALASPGTANSLGANKAIVIDTTAPAVASIDDGDADNAVTVGTQLTYTVTFSEDINSATVSAADFNNAGTASITIGTITETNPGVFSVKVTPTSLGSVILRIPTGAVISDVAGNNLAVPVQDNDTVTARPTLKFDMKSSATATLPAGWNRVLKTSTYNANDGYGWASSTVITATAGTKPAANKLPPGGDADVLADYHTGSDPTAFRIFVGANQSATVRIYTMVVPVIPGVLYQSGLTATAENGSTATATTMGYTYVDVTGNAGADGILDISIGRNATTAKWLVSGIEVLGGPI